MDEYRTTQGVDVAAEITAQAYYKKAAEERDALLKENARLKDIIETVKAYLTIETPKAVLDALAEYDAQEAKK